MLKTEIARAWQVSNRNIVDYMQCEPRELYRYLNSGLESTFEPEFLFDEVLSSEMYSKRITTILCINDMLTNPSWEWFESFRRLRYPLHCIIVFYSFMSPRNMVIALNWKDGFKNSLNPADVSRALLNVK